MAEYTTKRFATLFSASVIIGVLTVSFAPLGITYLFPVTRAYIQLSTVDASGEPSPTPWARLNHTLVITGNRVESYLVASAIMEPDPSPSNITIEILFEPFDYDPADNLVPVVTGGTVKWSGEMHQGDTVAIRTSLELPSDGMYFIGGSAVSSAPWSTMGGAATRLFLQVQWGIASKVFGAMPMNATSEIEGTCIANC